VLQYFQLPPGKFPPGRLANLTLTIMSQPDLVRGMAHFT
jgi:hypothetical protein